jgi:Uri superfamily endonuclease
MPKRIIEQVQTAIQDLHKVCPEMTTRQIGKHMGVSCATVSRVIAGYPARVKIGIAYKARIKRELKEEQKRRAHALYLRQREEQDALVMAHKRQTANLAYLDQRELNKLEKDFERLSG